MGGFFVLRYYIQSFIKAIANRVGLDLLAPNGQSAEFKAELEGGKIYALMMVVNGNFDSLTDSDPSNDPRVYFAYGEANIDSFDHIHRSNETTFEFEDLFGGGDRDFDDMIVEIDL